MMSGDEVRPGVLCEDKDGNQMKITEIDSEDNVHWRYLNQSGAGKTYIQDFIRDFEAIRNVA
jgi:hypothetical protein